MPTMFVQSLQKVAREAGIANPEIESWPEWKLFDQPKRGARVEIGTFTSAIDILNRISDVAAEYAAKERVR